MMSVPRMPPELFERAISVTPVSTAMVSPKEFSLVLAANSPKAEFSSSDR